MTICRKCGAEWSSKIVQHCSGCHATFASTKPGDAHRVGDHALTEGPNRRRCLSPEEMTEGGMWTTISATGAEIWHGHVSPTGKQDRKPSHWPDGAPQSDAQPRTLTEVPPELPGPQIATQGR